MVGAICFAVMGILLLLLGGIGLRSLEHASVKHIQLVYMSLGVGGVLLGLAIVVMVSRLRYHGTVSGSSGGGDSVGPYDDRSSHYSGHGHGSDCAHTDGGGDGGGCGDGGGGGH